MVFFDIKNLKYFFLKFNLFFDFYLLYNTITLPILNILPLRNSLFIYEEN